MSNEGPPTVTVVVPAYDTQPRIDRLLGLLSAQTYPPDRFDVVVVDDGSEHGLAVPDAMAGWVRIIRQQNAGSYTARNTGVREATGTVLAFTDTDCEPATDWLARGVERLTEDPEIGLVGGRIELYVPRGQYTGAGLYDVLHNLDQQSYVSRLGFAATANAFTWRRVFESIGGFDESLRSSGDKDFGRRVTAGGYRIAYDERTLIRHPARTSLHDLLRKLKRVYLHDRDPKYEVAAHQIITGFLWNLRPPVLVARRKLARPEVPPAIAPRARYVGVLFLVRSYTAALQARVEVRYLRRGAHTR